MEGAEGRNGGKAWRKEGGREEDKKGKTGGAWRRERGGQEGRGLGG